MTNGATLTLYNLILRAGYVAQGPGVDDNGGSVRVVGPGSSARLLGVTFRDNIVVSGASFFNGRGGAVCGAHHATVNASRCDFINNTGTCGGALCMHGGFMHVSQCTFRDCYCSTVGGGLLFIDYDLGNGEVLLNTGVIEHTEFIDCVSGLLGGGAGVLSSAVLFNHVRFTRCRTVAVGAPSHLGGGGLHSFSGGLDPVSPVPSPLTLT